jgi:transcriptional regulator with XRE-family HTH domain
MTDTQTLAAVIGANCRKIREDQGLTQAQLAEYARLYGLRWTANRVSDVEAGRSELPFSTVLALSLALDTAIRSGPGPFSVLRADGSVTRRSTDRVKLADLVASDGYVRITPEAAPTGDALAKVCSGKTWELYAPDLAETADVEALLDLAEGVPGQLGLTVGQLNTLRARSDVTETRTAKRLGISRDHLLALGWRLWEGRTFSQERDRRTAGNPARRGPVSRELITELERTLTDGNH